MKFLAQSLPLVNTQINSTVDFVGVQNQSLAGNLHNKIYLLYICVSPYPWKIVLSLC